MHQSRRKAGRVLVIVLAFLAATVAFPAAVAEGHDPDTKPDDPCDCHPELRIREIPFQQGADPHDPDREAYRGTVIVDLVVPDHCECFLEGWKFKSRAVTDLPGGGEVEGVQLDNDTWAFTAPDANTHFVTMTAYVLCEAEHPCHECEGTFETVTLSWYQFN